MDNSIKGKGFLKILATTGGVLPLEGVTVKISKQDENGEKLYHTGITDISGQTISYEVPAPLSDFSQQPISSDNPILPYSKYTITASMPKYYTVIFKDVPVFDSITSLQTVPMVPLPEGVQEATAIVYESQSPNL